MVILAIEGANKTGKTTLCRKLSEYYKIPTTSDNFRYDDIPEQKREEIIPYLETQDYRWFQTFKNVNFIADRFLVSKLLYDELRNKLSGFTFETILNDFPKAIFIFLKNDSYIDRMEEIGNKTEILKIYKLYNEFYDMIMKEPCYRKYWDEKRFRIFELTNNDVNGKIFRFYFTDVFNFINERIKYLEMNDDNYKELKI
jgi:adenylate kinase family enzyme